MCCDDREVLFLMVKCALPDHLKKRKHEDWIFPFKYLPRSINAFGSRCEGWLKWRAVPKLLVGYNVTRWMTVRDQGVVEWDDFEHKLIGCWRQLLKPEFGPSPLQKFSWFSFQVTWPLHYAFKVRFTEDRQFLFRKGCRWDSLDSYYNVSFISLVLAIPFFFWGIIPGILAIVLIPDYIGLAWN